MEITREQIEAKIAELVESGEVVRWLNYKNVTGYSIGEIECEERPHGITIHEVSISGYTINLNGEDLEYVHDLLKKKYLEESDRAHAEAQAKKREYALKYMFG